MRWHSPDSQWGHELTAQPRPRCLGALLKGDVGTRPLWRLILTSAFPGRCILCCCQPARAGLHGCQDSSRAGKAWPRPPVLHHLNPHHEPSTESAQASQRESLIWCWDDSKTPQTLGNQPQPGESRPQALSGPEAMAELWCKGTIWVQRSFDPWLPDTGTQRQWTDTFRCQSFLWKKALFSGLCFF